MGIINKLVDKVSKEKQEDLTANEWYEKGVSQLSSGKLKKALKCFDKVFEIKPEVNPKYDLDAIVWNNRGHALKNLGRYQEAIDSFQKFIELASPTPMFTSVVKRAKENINRIKRRL